jgi:tRNA-splicing ligase RtcB
MKARELENLGIPRGAIMTLALELIGAARGEGMKVGDIRVKLRAVANEPASFEHDAIFGPLAIRLGERSAAQFREREKPAAWKRFGRNIEQEAMQQMRNAARLPVAQRGALMPDAHVGYGLPIGGVLATKGAVIPYAVGVDIACRMKLTVLDLPLWKLKGEVDKLQKVLEEETRFGIGANFDRRDRRDHAIMDEDWGVLPILNQHKDKAWSQLGSSGSGNHFVEFGVVTLAEADMGLEAGAYVALLSHSGSRGAGAKVANHYSRVARELRPDLPKELKHLAWLDMDSADGQEYWHAMNMMGRYAAANHEMIHKHVAKSLGAKVLADIENHHNFAWKEEHDGEEMIVHRKGATPAGEGVMGVIPGSMTAPGYVVRGKGNAESLESASHGAGRAMSRTAARRSTTWSKVKKQLAEADVVLMSAGLDEAPDAYKDIDEVMSHQTELVEVVARFDPKVVRMAPAGEPPED